MNDSDGKLGRLETAVDRLEAALVRLPSADAAALAAECERLEAENAALGARAELDAELRAEAVAAVKAALEDLRSLMQEEDSDG